MATRTQRYDNLADARVAKLRTRTNKNERPFQTNRIGDHIEIVWTDDPTPPPIPLRNLTQREFLDELAVLHKVNLI